MSYNITWTLFLDRDGVINKELRDDYVTRWEEFNFEEGALSALAKLSAIFGRIIIVTNQRGIGIQKMTEADLNAIHQQMQKAIEDEGGRIDAIYFAPSAERSDIRRKPNPTMALEAQHDFPEIDLSKSVIVGNSISDMEFGRNTGMITVFIDEKKKFSGLKTDIMDEIHNSLFDWSNSL
jgi:histidinol-phosphate phosphatase family protein